MHRRLSARAAAVSALRGSRRHRLGLLRDGTPARHRRPRTRSRRRSPTRRRGGASARRSIDTLADLHAIDVAAPAQRARQAGRLRRASGARLDRSLASIEDDDAAGDGRARRLAARASARRIRAQPSVVHGDFKLDNVHARPARCRPAGRGVRLGDERARRSARGRRDSAGVLVADRAAASSATR